jgi:hypothetical protein
MILKGYLRIRRAQAAGIAQLEEFLYLTALNTSTMA